METQRRLLTVPWPRDLNQDLTKAHYSETNTLLWNGLRAAMAIHCGKPHYCRSQDTMRADYYGAVWDEALDLDAQALGGEILVSEAAHRQFLQHCDVVMKESVSVRELAKPRKAAALLFEPFFQIFPSELAPRAHWRQKEPLLQVCQRSCSRGMRGASTRHTPDGPVMALGSRTRRAPHATPPPPPHLNFYSTKGLAVHTCCSEGGGVDLGKCRGSITHRLPTVGVACIGPVCQVKNI